MTVNTMENLDRAIESYGETAKSAAAKKIGKTALVGFGAAAAGGLFTASQADAGIVYSGILNIGFNVSTVNASSTNAISGFAFNSLGGATAFAIAGNNRGGAAGGTMNPVGTTDILWAVGAGYVGGFGGVFASPGMSFPTTVVPQFYSQIVGSQGTPASLAWAAVGLAPFPMAIDPFGLGTAGPNTVTGYFGFTFNTLATGGGQQRFGWAHIQLTGDGIYPTSMTLIDWAYDDAGLPLHVGIPEPATTGIVGLCALAAGAAGIRRRKSAKQAS